MPANRFGIDLAGAYRDIESIKGARTQNRLSSLKLGELERDISLRPERERKAQERQNRLSELRGGAVTGDVDAQQKLLALDPKDGPAFIDAISKMDERKRKQTKAVIDEIGNMSSYVLAGGDLGEQTRRYATMLNNISPEAAKKLPKRYSPKFVEQSLAKAQTMDQLLEAPTTRQVGGEDVVYRGGREIERATRPVKPGAGGARGAGGELKSADESLMYRQSVELLGGIFDQAGNITNLDPNTRNKVQAIATEATNIYKQSGTITRSEAVKQAAKKFGMNIADAPATDVTDPNSIRDYLLQN